MSRWTACEWNADEDADADADVDEDEYANEVPVDNERS